MNSRTPLFLVASILFALGCSDASDDGAAGGGVGGGTGISTLVGASCESLARDLCTKYEECASFLYTLTYTSLDRCIAANQNSCELRMKVAQGSNVSLQQEAACRHDAYLSLSCEQFNAHSLNNSATPASCIPPSGDLVDGLPCVLDTQCASLSCSSTINQVCGVCQPRAEEGERCESQRCAEGLSCNLQAGVCIRPRAAGGTCDAHADCDVGLSCVNGICGKRSFAGAGEPCDAFKLCSINEGLFCFKGVCKVAQAAGPGEACGLDLPAPTDCRAGSHCAGNTCLVDAHDGSPCDGVHGPACSAPAACIQGRCTLPSINPPVCP